MEVKPNTQELFQISRNLGIDIDVLEGNEAEKYIKKVIDIYNPFKVSGHLSIGGQARNIRLEGNEYLFSRYLKSEPAYIFFDQESLDRNTIVIVKDAKLIGKLMENSYGMEYFVSNENSDFLIAVNWYVIEVAGSAVEELIHLTKI